MVSSIAAKDVMSHPLMSKEAYGCRVIQNKGLTALKLTPGVQGDIAKAAWTHDVAMLERACAGQMFPTIPEIKYEGPHSTNPLAFRAYDRNYMINGKTLEEHTRISVAFWHAFRGAGADPFGGGTKAFPWDEMFDPGMQAVVRLIGAFEFMKKVGLPDWCAHDYDLLDGKGKLKELETQFDFLTDIALTLQNETGIKLAWFTNQFFSLSHYMEGAGSSPDPSAFLRALGQARNSWKSVNKLNGRSFVFWGGREGIASLINTDVEHETRTLAIFLEGMRNMAREMGFNGQLLIEPKAAEPTKYQYDHSSAVVIGFLAQHGLLDDFRINLEPNHGQLAGLPVDLELALAGKYLGGVDINIGSEGTGWDEDRYTCLTTAYHVARTEMKLREQGYFQDGGNNVDAKPRRTSTKPEDLVEGLIRTADNMSAGFMRAEMERKDGRLARMMAQRYSGWNEGLGAEILSGKHTKGFAALGQRVVDNEAQILTPIASGNTEGFDRVAEQPVLTAVVDMFRAANGG
jgi:xylose isomerase